MNILCGYDEEFFFVPPLPHILEVMMKITVAVVPTMECEMLESVWSELDWRIDVCLVTPHAHIKSL